MNLPDHYGYGTLFGFSGIDGENSHDEDFIGMTMPGPVTVRFDDRTGTATLHLDAENDKIDFILSDAIRTERSLLVFADKNTVIGQSTARPELFGDNHAAAKPFGGAEVLHSGHSWYALRIEGERFALCRTMTRREALRLAQIGLEMDIEALLERKLAYYRELPPCPDPDLEKLYYKVLSVSKVNVYSPQNGFGCRSTTPDRLPHRHVWLWDSMFHAIAFAQYNPPLAEESILAVLRCQRKDGFIPHMMESSRKVSRITQPQVIAWAALEVYRRSGSLSFLREAAPAISGYLNWFLKNRDRNHNGLLEWKMDFLQETCHCDESGMDNSPRFDVTEMLDAIDSSTFMVHDCRCMAEIYEILGDTTSAEKYRNLADSIAERINEFLWDEKKGIYCDRTFSGKLTGVMTCASFLPLFAGICTEERAVRLVSVLTDPDRFWSEMPVPSISLDDPAYGSDMWRGPVWLNYNYMIMQGLRKYGYTAEAEELCRRTLTAVRKVFDETGSVFEFYDPEVKTIPWSMRRKGTQPPVPDYRIKMHAITDYHWSAAFILLFILDH